MKLLTLNTHSLIEQEYEKKLDAFIAMIEQEQPDVFALEEVNQDREEENISEELLSDYYRPAGFELPLKKGNHALAVYEKLLKKGLRYHWTWISAKIGYDRYDEGLAIFSKTRLEEVENLLISKGDDYHYWKTRRCLGVKIVGSASWFYAVHMGWWDDEEEPFAKQWETLSDVLKSKGSVFLLGDFNSEDTERGRGYDTVTGSGFYDTYVLAKNKDEGFTVEAAIDGWKERAGKRQKRLDYIFTTDKIDVHSSLVVFNGRNYPIVSDHYGVMIEI